MAQRGHIEVPLALFDLNEILVGKKLFSRAMWWALASCFKTEIHSYPPLHIVLRHQGSVATCKPTGLISQCKEDAGHGQKSTPLRFACPPPNL